MLQRNFFLHDDLDILADHFSGVITKDSLGGRTECLQGPFLVDRDYPDRTCLDDLRYPLLTELELGLDLLQIFILRAQLCLVALDRGNVGRNADKTAPANRCDSYLYRTTGRGFENHRRSAALRQGFEPG